MKYTAVIDFGLGNKRNCNKCPFHDCIEWSETYIGAKDKHFCELDDREEYSTEKLIEQCALIAE